MLIMVNNNVDVDHGDHNNVDVIVDIDHCNYFIIMFLYFDFNTVDIVDIIRQQIW